MIEKSTIKSNLYDSQFIKMFPILVSACNGNNSSELLLCLIFVKIFQFFIFHKLFRNQLWRKNKKQSRFFYNITLNIICWFNALLVRELFWYSNLISASNRQLTRERDVVQWFGILFGSFYFFFKALSVFFIQNCGWEREEGTWLFETM